jgi:hypothetical protein
VALLGSSIVRYALPDELGRAVDGLYETFRGYQRPDRMTGDGFTAAENERLCRKGSLSQLTVGDLERYAFKAMTTWGGKEDFKHFLPRLFEIAAAEGRIGDTELEVLYGKLAYGDQLPQGNWLSWRDEERVAVESYLRAAWARAVRTFPPPGEAWEGIDAWLCGIVQSCTDVGLYLAHWSGAIAAGDLAAIRNLAAFADQHWENILTRRALRNAWWPLFPEAAQRVIAWVCLPEQAESVERACFAQPPGPVADELSEGVRNLEALRDYALR